MTKGSQDVRVLAGWCHAWFSAAFRQAQRAFDAPEPGTDGYDGSDETELLMFVTATNNLARAARAVLGRDSDSVREFDAAIPGLKEIRDQIEHFDEYVVGEGRLQKNTGSSGDIFWQTSVSGGSISYDDGSRKKHMVLSVLSDINASGAGIENMADQESHLPDAVHVVPALESSLVLIGHVLREVGVSDTPMTTEVRQWILAQSGGRCN